MKTKPIGVRFNEEESVVVMKALGLRTHQALVNHLLRKEFEAINKPVYDLVVNKCGVEIEKIKEIMGSTLVVASKSNPPAELNKFADILRKAKNGQKYEVGELKGMGLNNNQVSMVMQWQK